MGQMLDLMSQPQGKKGPEVLKNFSKVRLQQIVDYKTAYYTFYLPIVSAMVICGLDSAEQMRHAKEISVMLGRKFQTQDDFLDCFGDPQHIGKVGTDIQDHKCTWLLVNALDLASDDQRKIIEENLGKEDEDSVSKIKNLYKDLALDALFDQFETDSYDEISKAIDAASASIPTLLFSKILNKIHRRSY